MVKVWMKWRRGDDTGEWGTESVTLCGRLERRARVGAAIAFGRFAW